MDDGKERYDPLESALKRGKILGEGASGHYRKNLLTRIGFILIAIPFLFVGIAFGLSVFNEQPIGNYSSETKGLVYLVNIFLSLACIALSGFLIKNALSKNKKRKR